jgi:PAS domain S-box-containing protein
MERGKLVAKLLRVRAVVYVVAGVPLLFIPDSTTAAVVFGICAIAIASVNPFVARRVGGRSGVRLAALSDLVVAYGLWLFSPKLSGIALMLAMWSVGFSVLVGSARDGRLIAGVAVAFEASKIVLLVLGDSLMAPLPAVEAEISPLLLIGGAAGLAAAYHAFGSIDQYFVALNDAAETGEERHRKLMDAAPTAFLVVVDDSIVYANEAANRLLNHESGSLTGVPIRSLIHEESVAQFKTVRGQVLNKLTTVENEHLVFLPGDGSTLWADVSVTAVDYGHDLALQLMLQDRSGQHRAEEQLRRTRLDYQMFFERIPVALYRSRPDGEITDANHALVELVGADTREEIIGKSALTFYVDPNERDRLTEMLSDDGVVAGYEWQLRTSNGAVKWVRDTSRLIETVNGRFYEGAVVDVTARRNVEDELWSRAVQQEAAASIGQLALETEDVAALCEALSEMVSEVLGTDGVAVMQRGADGAFEMIGASPDLGIEASMLSGIADRTHMSSAPVVLKSGDEVRLAAPAVLGRGYESCISLMVPGKEIDFGTLIVLAGGQRIFSPDDLNFLHAVTNVLAAAVDRARAYARLEALVESKDAFVASVSHELRTPLTVVTGLAHELSQRWMTLSDEEMSEFTTMLVGQSEDMSDLIEDLLVAARSNIGNVAVRIVPVEVGAEVAGVLAGFEAQTDRTIGAEVPEVTISADPSRLRQILRNLVSNAIRYGGSNVVVEGFVSSGLFVLEVKDDGDPIPEADRDRIFEAYERAHDTSGRPGSVGLGLAVSRTLAELMRGSLTYRHDGWSVFRLELPATVDDLDGGPASGVGHDETFSTFGAIGSSRIGVDVAAIK